VASNVKELLVFNDMERVRDISIDTKEELGGQRNALQTEVA
jgi:hypothetical protein